MQPFLTLWTTDRYCYEPLDTSRQTIRLLEVLPQDTSGKITLSLRQYSLNDVAGCYNAISYTWGPDQLYDKVCIDGRWLMVRKNLWHFLRHYRSSSHSPSRRLWIDSICIDQETVQEKNLQVQMMRQIYGQAERVLIWLGKDSCFSSSLAKHIEMKLCKEKHHDWAGYLQRIIQSIPDRTHDEEEVLALTSIMDNDYWWRLWIVQEIVLARQCFLICGSALLRIDHVRDIFTISKLALIHPCEDDRARKPRYLPFEYPTTSILTSRLRLLPLKDPVHVLTEYAASRKTRGLGHLVFSYFRQSCHDKRDHVYGLLGMTEWAENFLVDYSIHEVDLFVKALHHIVLEKDTWEQPHGRMMFWDCFERLMLSMNINLQLLEQHADKQQDCGGCIIDHRFPLRVLTRYMVYFCGDLKERPEYWREAGTLQAYVEAVSYNNEDSGHKFRTSSQYNHGICRGSCLSCDFYLDGFCLLLRMNQESTNVTILGVYRNNPNLSIFLTREALSVKSGDYRYESGFGRLEAMLNLHYKRLEAASHEPGSTFDIECSVLDLMCIEKLVEYNRYFQPPHIANSWDMGQRYTIHSPNSRRSRVPASP